METASLINRELVFRAWHKQTKTMHYNIGPDEDFIILKSGQGKLGRADCILMQLTGVLDEKGNKVWEGNILRNDVTWLDGIVPEGEEEYSYYVYVGFHGGGYALFPVDCDGSSEEIEYLK